MTIEELQGIELIHHIETAVLEKCYNEKEIFVRRYAKGATVHHQYDKCTSLDVVLSGSLVAYALSENGSVMNMFGFQKNSIIGANLLFGDNNKYPFNIYGETSCKLLHITQNAVEEFLHNYNFVILYIKSLSMNSQGMNQKITMMTQKKLRDNLLDYLKQQSFAQGSSKIILSVSKKRLADYLGVQRPSLFRALKKLKDEKIIEVDNHTITLLRNTKQLYA